MNLNSCVTHTSTTPRSIIKHHPGDAANMVFFKTKLLFLDPLFKTDDAVITAVIAVVECHRFPLFIKEENDVFLFACVIFHVEVIIQIRSVVGVFKMLNRNDVGEILFSVYAVMGSGPVLVKNQSLVVDSRIMPLPGQPVL